MRTRLVSLLIACGLGSPGLLLALPQVPPPATAAQELPAAAPAVRVLLDGHGYQLPVTVTEHGPLFALPPLVGWLGGSLEPGAYGEGFRLKLREAELLFGPESPTVTLRNEILPPLSQPPAMTAAGLAVPLDFLRMSFGDLGGHRFHWDPAQWQLTIERYQPLALQVAPTLEHQSGVSTLSLRFSAPPRFRIQEQPGGLDMVILGDPLQATGAPARQDPLVEELTFTADRIQIRLAPDALVVRRPRPSQSSTQLVFEFERSRTAPGAVPGLPASEGTSTPGTIRPRRRTGIHRIVLDPGHGGSDTGAIAASGIVEKELTLQLARRLQGELQARLPGVQVLLTRNDDRNLSLEARTSIANQEKADLFISLHLNSSFGSRAQGTETYILSLQASDPRAAAAAEQENRSGEPAPASGGSGGDPLYDLQLILWDMAQSYQLNESQRFAALIQGELNSTLGLRDRGVKQAPFRVLMGAAMPAVLVELGFLSHPDEEAQLQDAEYQGRLAAALARAVAQYRDQLDASPEGEP